MKTKHTRPRTAATSRQQTPAGEADATRAFARRLASRGTGQMYVLRLFVTGSTPRSTAAIATIREICDQHLAGNFELEVVDIYQRPAAAVGEQIIAAPTLVKQQPKPVRRMVGSLSDRERVLVGLDIPSPRA